MYGHCIQTLRAFKVRFKLCQTAGSWGKNSFIPPSLLNDNSRDQEELLKLLLWSRVLKEEDELFLKFCQHFFCMPTLNLLPTSYGSRPNLHGLPSLASNTVYKRRQLTHFAEDH